ncbi:MAG TPA: peptidylprolyl isomerase [Gemmatimonadales bacterium]|nr:peptidylprolyl isomerase [Gemmatimonadales bacterium]
MRRAAAVLLASVLVVPALRAQDPGDSGGPPLQFRCDTTGTVVDRIVAVVGEAPILSSQVEEEIFTQRSQNGAPPAKTPAEFVNLCRQVVSDLIDAEVLVQAAQRDTAIKVEETEIAQGVDEQFRNIRQRFKTEPEFRAELNKSGFQTPEEFRRWLTENQRKAALRNRLISKLRDEGKLKPVQPTEKEMRAYFELYKDQLPARPATISFRNIIVAPKASEEAKEKARLQADSIVRELRKGADFATAAKRFSQDPASAEQGGDLGWFRRGQMVKEFEAVAFSQRPGAVSDPVESPFGFHIIQVQRIQPAEVQARHILIMPQVVQADADSAFRLAGTIATLLKSGANFDSLSRIYHDPGEERDTPDDVPVTQLPEEYKAGIGAADSGQVVGPFEIRKEMGLRRKYVVLEVKSRHTEGAVLYEDVKDQIRQRLAGDLAQKRFVDRIRRSTYVDIRL